MSVLSVEQLSLSFIDKEAKQEALSKLAFSIQPGQTVALLGESGCGKSLTSHAILNLLPDNTAFSQHSKVVFNGSDLLDMQESRLRSYRGDKIAMIFQEPMTALNPVLTIGQQITEVLKKHTQLDAKAIQVKTINLLKEVEIPEAHERIHFYPHQLSGGQKQRVMIAMAIACEPELLIADEPTTALDVTIQWQILKLLKKLQQHYKMGILLITHDLSVVKAVADIVCVMYAGQLVEKAKVRGFFVEAKHPYSQQLMAAMPSMDKRDSYLHSIQGIVPPLGHLPSGCRFHPRCLHKVSCCDNQEPRLSEKDGHEVRCHLFPELSHLPALNLKADKHEDTIHDEELVLSVADLKVYFSQTHGILKRSKSVFKAVDGVSLALNKGKTLAIVGESGCGKTTLSRAILQLIPMTSGKAIFQGQNLASVSQAELVKLRKDMQIIFQDPFSSMNPRLLVLEIIAEGIRAHKLLKKDSDIEKRVAELLTLVGMPTESMTRYPHQFSGGQRQRLCIARALALEPKLIICDEPTSALDVSVQAQILNLLKRLQHQLGLSYLFITHDMSVVAYMADEVMVMQAGRVIESGLVTDVLINPKQDYTKKLLESVLVP